MASAWGPLAFVRRVGYGLKGGKCFLYRQLSGGGFAGKQVWLAFVDALSFFSVWDDRDDSGGKHLGVHRGTVCLLRDFYLIVIMVILMNMIIYITGLMIISLITVGLT